MDRFDTRVATYADARGAAFPGSPQAQQRTPSQFVEHANHRNGRSGRGSDAFESYFYATVFHTDFAPEWPIATDWPAVVRGLRGSFALAQTDFAELCGLGRATIERWESGKVTPFRGDALQVLSLVRPHLCTPVQAGQALNLAAGAVLPHLTRPTSEYLGADVVAPLCRDGHNHSDLGPAVLSALESARILVVLDPGSDELDTTYFPLVNRPAADGHDLQWAQGILKDLAKLSNADRQLVARLARRLVAE
ncbi:helix-turn-helix domain-containing protein [Nocardioides carbamazepini]|uniref:helix-turn-helix domain-containing protein n=1 Tax=Nocardioides carbamazepini TaxID=2854259 RepID=UPI00214A4D38|nr:helix-turn-helix domain-containing protein [Nocardioides carbamazepini]MCR1785922.1 helix-turn-helix domain-containing protein [Nocardioides carbamazepini]